MSAVLFKLIDVFAMVSLQHCARPTSSVLLIYGVSIRPGKSAALHLSQECILSVLYLLHLFMIAIVHADSTIACASVQYLQYSHYSWKSNAHKSHQSLIFSTLNRPIQNPWNLILKRCKYTNDNLSCQTQPESKRFVYRSYKRNHFKFLLSISNTPHLKWAINHTAWTFDSWNLLDKRYRMRRNTAI